MFTTVSRDCFKNDESEMVGALGFDAAAIPSGLCAPASFLIVD
jgi:hypothetical protein